MKKFLFITLSVFSFNLLLANENNVYANMKNSLQADWFNQNEETGDVTIEQFGQIIKFNNATGKVYFNGEELKEGNEKDIVKKYFVDGEDLGYDMSIEESLNKLDDIYGKDIVESNDGKYDTQKPMYNNPYAKMFNELKGDWFNRDSETGDILIKKFGQTLLFKASTGELYFNGISLKDGNSIDVVKSYFKLEEDQRFIEPDKFFEENIKEEQNSTNTFATNEELEEEASYQQELREDLNNDIDRLKQLFDNIE